MAVTLEELVVRLRADSAQLERELRNVQGSVRKASDGIERSFTGARRGLDSVRTAAAGIGAAIAGIGIAALGREVREALDFGGDLRDASDRIGENVEALQELRFAAQDFGVDAGTLDTALVRLSKKVAEAANGNEKAAETFRLLGIEVRDAGGEVRPASDVLTDLADRLVAIDDPATRVQVAMELLGKSGARLIPLLMSGADGLESMRAKAQTLGAVLDEELVNRADELGDQLTQLETVIKVQFAGALIELGPLLVSTAGFVADVTANVVDLFNAFDDASELSGTALDRRIRERVEALARTRRDAPGDTAAARVLEDEIARLTAERFARDDARAAGEARARQNDLARQLGFDEFGNPLTGERIRFVRPTKTKGAKAAKKEDAEAFDPLAAVLRRFRDEEKDREEATKRLASLERSLTDEYLSLTNQRIAAIRNEEKARLDELDALEIRFAGHSEKLQEIADLRVDVHRNAEAEIRAESAKSAEEMKAAAQGFGDFFGNVVSGLVLQTEQDFDALIKSILASILQLGASRGFSALAESAFKGVGGGGGGGGVGGFFVSLLGSIFGATAFADGGIVTRPVLGLVGEAGPEAIIPLSRAGGLGNGLTVNVINRAPNVDVTATRNPRTGELDVAVESSVRRMHARGGARDLSPAGRHQPGRGA